jgi:hypothetical protein
MPEHQSRRQASPARGRHVLAALLLAHAGPADLRDVRRPRECERERRQGQVLYLTADPAADADGGKPAELEREDLDEHQRRHEGRHRDAQPGGHRDQHVQPGEQRRQHAEPEPDHQDDQRRKRHQLQGDRQPRSQQGADALVELQRDAEVTVQSARQPVPVPDGKRLVKPVLVPDVREDLRRRVRPGELGGRVAWRQRQRAVDQQAGNKQRADSRAADPDRQAHELAPYLDEPTVASDGSKI